MSLSKYRSDIDGLRAIAVAAVMLFHAGVVTFSGGFIGVDIFFVISGYLITSILISEIESETFSILKFYERRIRRIIPALLFMMVISSLIFFFILLPDDLENFGQSIFATIFFANNILLWITSGYFDSSIELKPLAHTWSLGVEEQFYLFAPILLLVGYKFWKHQGIIALLTISFISSFAFCIFASNNWPDTNFYLIFSRIWEIGAGSIAATKGAAAQAERISNKLSAWLSNLSLIVIIISLYAYGQNKTNPNFYTLAVISATYAIIMFNRPGFWAHRVLSNRTLLFVGGLSYSLYLWHQPVYVFIRVTSLEEPGLALFTIGAIISFMLAYISWRFIELPFRDRAKVSVKKLYLYTGLTSALLLAVSLSMHFTSGFYSRWPELAQGDKDFGKGMNIAFNERPYRFLGRDFDPASDRQKILVIGNSFARDFINMMEKTNRLNHVQLVYSDVQMCEIGTTNVPLMRAAAQADAIVVATKLDEKLAKCVLHSRALFAKQGNAQFVVIGTKNFGWNNNAIMMIDPSERYGYQAKVVEEYLISNDVGRRTFAKDEYVDVLALISKQPGYVPVFTDDKKFISQDREHLTPAGATFIGRKVFQSPILSKLAPPKQP